MSTVSLWRRDPFAEFDAVVRQAFGPAFAQAPAAAQRRAFVPSAEVTRDGQDAVVAVEVPGLDAAKDVAVEVERGRLIVRGERRDETGGDRGRREIRYGSFRREFVLPEHVTADAVSAVYDAGVLRVRVADAFAEARPGRVAITVGTAAPVEAAVSAAPAEVEAEVEAPKEA
ncbi:HSP20 family molecular chaperone IbpA [Actinocorallia herbida]|uniref:HSP20 family molecular chaperone IbpA n=1 Tax=Actinocorallia herbida TaxID=58109 RepID=A0A3N1CNR8_9ACTN|nr:Hsp20/alpha crystallin family protein [Actinocorallia herbida]ROO82977.1 HSP20 family molecular chaperone IbpA [Actinocorallia herbida]